MPDTANTKSDLEIPTRLNADFLAPAQNGDVRRYEQILAEDFMASLPDFLLRDKKQFLEMMAAPRPSTEPRADKVRIRLLADIAIILAPCERPTAYNDRGDTLMSGGRGMENGFAWQRTRFKSLDVVADRCGSSTTGSIARRAARFLIKACRRAIAPVAALLSACWAVVCAVKNAPVDPPVRNEYGEIVPEEIWHVTERDYGKDTCPECRS